MKRVKVVLHQLEVEVRIWATDILKEYMIKGFVMDENKAVERINNDYKIDCECAGIEPNPNGLIRKFYPHIVRHTFVTRCAEKGIDVRVACALAGHASLSITNDIYTHISETVKILECQKLWQN